MRYSTVCACKWLIKFIAAIIVIVITFCIGLHSETSTDHNATLVATTPTLTPEEELQIYIKNLSSWQGQNDSATVNSHPYQYLIVPTKICKLNGAVSDPFLLIVVKSYVSNIGHREAIRSTWGKDLPPSVRLVFILGYLDFMKSYIAIESRRYKDIIQEDFFDVYRNNTVKTIMGFNWAVTNCKESQYTFFVDDDYIVNIPKLLTYIKSHQKKSKGVGLYAGYMWEKAYPKRSHVSKWYVPYEDYPCKFWPKYVGGGSMMISMDVASAMKEAFPFIKPIFIDDVYIGIVAATLGVKVQMEGKFSPDYKPDKIGLLYSTHGVESSSALIHDWEMVKSKIRK